MNIKPDSSFQNGFCSIDGSCVDQYTGDTQTCKEPDCEVYIKDLFNHRWDEKKYLELMNIPKIEKSIKHKLNPNLDSKNKKLCEGTVYNFDKNFKNGGEIFTKKVEKCFNHLKILPFF